MSDICYIVNHHISIFLLRPLYFFCSSFFFFNDTATTEIYTLSLHDALPIWTSSGAFPSSTGGTGRARRKMGKERSEEHTSELQSLTNLVCRLLLEKKKKKKKKN